MSRFVPNAIEMLCVVGFVIGLALWLGFLS
jgi:hypothetical protein